ncbi:MAG: hypothetical protein CEE43_18315 [Promethearchaeota archaeon Loki_b32]|nr:MAG: hypothetical protein CEE43_18315 [Candidatus Lokiarchaeota archaeon Loki_b32]
MVNTRILIKGNYRSEKTEKLNLSVNQSSWTRTWNHFGFEHGLAVEVDNVNNVYVGAISEYTRSDSKYLCLLKYNSSGDLIWERIWRSGSTGHNYITIAGLAIDSSNNIYIAGTEGSNRESVDMILIRYDVFGNKIWNISWGGDGIDECIDIKIDLKGDIFLVGETENSTSGLTDITVVQFDSTGTEICNFTLEYIRIDEVSTLEIDSADNIYIGGAYKNDATLIKLNSSGFFQWDYTLWYLDSFSKILIDSLNNIIVSSLRTLHKFNSSGTQLWNSTYTGPGFGYVSLTTDSSNDIYVGQSKVVKCVSNSFFVLTGCICTNIFLIKYNSEGDIIWEKRFTGCSDDYVADLTFDSLGNLYVCGTLRSKGGCDKMIWDVLLLKNPEEYRGQCFIFYWDLFLVILIPSIIILALIVIYLRKRRKDENTKIKIF